MKPTLLVLAAGMGSRFGGIKQIEPVGKNGECLLDYSTYDAIKAGFGKVIYIIRKEIEEDFKKNFFDRISKKVNADYVFQNFESGLTNEEVSIAKSINRTKPWGTTHAILCARFLIHEPFAVINADDYYGRAAFETLANYLSNVDCSSNDNAMVGYVLENTMSRNGSVSRGICKVNEGSLEGIKEVHEIYYNGDNFSGNEILYKENDKVNKLSGKEIVSMNLFGFTPKIFSGLQQCWDNFKKSNLNNPKSEDLLPEDVQKLIKSGSTTIKVFTSKEAWFGMTYSADKQVVKDAILSKIESGYYPDVL